MFEVTVIMNSSIEDVLGFKCCSLHDMNLEIILYNRGDRPQPAPGGFALENDRDKKIFCNVYPPWQQMIPPGDCTAIYCQMDEVCWRRYHTLVISDGDGRAYRVPINREESVSGNTADP